MRAFSRRPTCNGDTVFDITPVVIGKDLKIKKPSLFNLNFCIAKSLGGPALIIRLQTIMLEVQINPATMLLSFMVFIAYLYTVTVNSQNDSDNR